MQLHLKSKPRTVKPALTRLAAMGPPLQHANNVTMEQARAHMHMQVQVRVHDAHVSETNEADSPAHSNCYTLRGGACRRAQTCKRACLRRRLRSDGRGRRARREREGTALAWLQRVTSGVQAHMRLSFEQPSPGPGRCSRSEGVGGGEGGGSSVHAPPPFTTNKTLIQYCVLNFGHP